jgi:hypothetical protein
MHATFSDLVHEAKDQGNKDMIQAILQKFDDAIKVHGFMAQAHDVMAEYTKTAFRQTAADGTTRSPSRS